MFEVMLGGTTGAGSKFIGEVGADRFITGVALASQIGLDKSF